MSINYFNTALALSMLRDGNFSVITVDSNVAKEFLESGVENVANPTHGNTLQAVTQVLGFDVRRAKGGKVVLTSGDKCLVAQIGNIPRETREFTDEEIAKATFEYRIVTVL